MVWCTLGSTFGERGWTVQPCCGELCTSVIKQGRLPAMVSKAPLCPNWVAHLAKTLKQMWRVVPCLDGSQWADAEFWQVPAWLTRDPYHSLGRGSCLWIIKIFRLQMWRKLGVRSYLEMSFFFFWYYYNLRVPVSACIFAMEGRFAKLGVPWSLQDLPDFLHL